MDGWMRGRVGWDRAVFKVQGVHGAAAAPTHGNWMLTALPVCLLKDVVSVIPLAGYRSWLCKQVFPKASEEITMAILDMIFVYSLVKKHSLRESGLLFQFADARREFSTMVCDHGLCLVPNFLFSRPC